MINDLTDCSCGYEDYDEGVLMHTAIRYKVYCIIS